MKRALRISLLIAWALASVAATLGQATASADEEAAPCSRASELVEALLEAEHLPGVQGAVLERGVVVCSLAFGLADLEQRVPVTEITRFRIGSISKSLTSAALGLLVEEGRLDLDAPVQRYVSTFPQKKYPITTRQLAGHLSGLPHYGPMDFINTTHYPDVISALDKFKDRELLFEPGERFEYSSFGWNLIAAVVQEASGVEFLELMERRVFSPLDMPHTVADHYRQLIPHRTRFYQVSTSGLTQNAPAIDNSDVWAGGGFLSTAEDLTRFADHLATGRLLRRETVALLFESLETNAGEGTGYGLGWSGGEHQGRRWVGHGGSHVGARTRLIYFPEERLSIALLTNANSRSIGSKAMEVAELFLPQ